MPFNPDDLIAAKTASDKKPRKKGASARSIFAGIVLLLAGLGALHEQYQSNTSVDGALAKAAAEMQSRLPVPYSRGRIIESTSFHDKKIVMTIRYPNLPMAQASASSVDNDKQFEQRVLIATCGLESIKFFLDNGIAVIRRFESADHKLLFEVSATSKECPHT